MLVVITLVIFGLHWGLIPIAFNNLSQFGSDTLSTLITPAIFGQAGAVFGVWLKSKQTKVKEIAGSATISAIIGITEPAIYKVTQHSIRICVIIYPLIAAR